MKVEVGVRVPASQLMCLKLRWQSRRLITVRSWVQVPSGTPDLRPVGVCGESGLPELIVEMAVNAKGRARSLSSCE